MTEETKPTSPLRAILIGGLIAGALDITYACVSSLLLADIPPATILQSVASGVLEADAYQGGTSAAALGLALHFAMMLLITAIYVYIVRSIAALRAQNPWLMGPMYGVAVYFVMNRVVIPLSAFPMKTPYINITFLSLAVHMFLIGLVMALAESRTR
ncbi:MAG: hypothetical protein JNM81_13185 [Rhodospirillaceae bacterium]|nr:hypothetical protein [Rhodospirillaceae bacterium]